MSEAAKQAVRRVMGQYNPQWDIIPNTPLVTWPTMQLATTLQEVLERLDNIEQALSPSANPENGAQILPEDSVGTGNQNEIAKYVSEFISDQTEEVRQSMLEALFMEIIGVPLVVAAEVIEKHYDLHGLVVIRNSDDDHEAHELLRTGVKFYLHGE